MPSDCVCNDCNSEKLKEKDRSSEVKFFPGDELAHFVCPEPVKEEKRSWKAIFDLMQ